MMRFASESEWAVPMSFDLSGGARWVIGSPEPDLSTCGKGKNLEYTLRATWEADSQGPIVAGASISCGTFDVISRVMAMVGRMDAVGGPLLVFSGDSPFVSNKLSFRAFPQAVVRTSRNAVSWGNSVPALLRALRPISSSSHCVRMDGCRRCRLPFIFIGVFRSLTADDLFKCSDPEARSGSCFASLELRKRSSEKMREGKPW
ncbi:hypothetical protein EI94DRAFT_1719939 [Lactarius quietus]|nr:hypothetical protein EI94DRAFT_1719939 [Lactarius quietus]